MKKAMGWVLEKNGDEKWWMREVEKERRIRERRGIRKKKENVEKKGKKRKEEKE